MNRRTIKVNQLETHPILVHAHRGAHRGTHGGVGLLWPENTLPAFESAIAAGVDAIELDLALTRDNVVVVSHDPHLHPPDGREPEPLIYSLTLAEVREFPCGAPIPTLDEIFALASKGNFLFNLEVKTFPEHPERTASPEDFVTLLLEKIRKQRLESRVIVQSFDFRTLRVMQRLAPEIALGALHEGAPRDFIELARESGAGIVAPQFNLVTSEQVRAAHASGLRVMTWTPNATEDWDRLIAARVDAIITDDPRALLARLGRSPLQ